MSAVDVLDLHWHTFSADLGRHGLYSGDHWTSVDAPPSHDALRLALSGEGPAISGLFLDDDARTAQGAVDVDIEGAWHTVLAIARELNLAGVRAYVEGSRRGGHVRVVLDGTLPGRLVRYGLLRAVELAGCDMTDPRIEIRPKVDRKSSPFAGGMLRLPYVPHPATGERYEMSDPMTGEIIAHKVADLHLRMDMADADALADLAMTYVPPAVVTPREPSKRDWPKESVSAALIEIGALDAAPGRSIRCPFHPDRNPSMKIADDDERAWCHSPSCIAHENGRGITAWGIRQLAAVPA